MPPPPHPRPDPPFFEVEQAVRRALVEDLTPLGDLSAALLPPDRQASASFVPRADGVLAGRACAVEAFRQVDPSIVMRWSARDGDSLLAGVPFATADGALASILTAERTALNFLGHLSGVATGVRRYVDAAAGGATVWDTRKTTPGLRALEKAAVRAGGGSNHRGNLSDWVMLKDNHLTGTTIAEAVTAARAAWPGRTVHVECDRIGQVAEALEVGADAILFDNMTPDEIRACVALVSETAPTRRPLLEASGGITLETIRSYADTGVDCISSGALTNSAAVLDIGLDIEVT